jgi:hypothetical protein
MKSTIFVILNKDNEVQKIQGVKQYKYFGTPWSLNEVVEQHNEEYPEDEWRVAKCHLVED